MPAKFSVTNPPPAFYTIEELLLALATLTPTSDLVDGVTITIDGNGRLRISGSLDPSFISSINAELLRGVIPAASIPTIVWAKIEEGTLPAARVPVIPKEKVAGVLGSLVDGQVASAVTADKAGKLTRVYASTWTSLSALTAGTNGATDFTHGLVSVPEQVLVQFKFGAAVAGYAVDDVIPLHALHVIEGISSQNAPVVWLASATEVKVIWPFGATVYVTNKTSGARTALTAGNVQASSIRVIASLIA